MYAVVLSQVFFLSIGLAFASISRADIPLSRPSIDDLYIIGIASLSSIFVLVGGGMAQSFLGLSPASEVHTQESGSILIGFWAVSLFLAPLAEELLFRGAIQGGLRSRTGPIVSIIGASSVFGAVHLLNFSGTLPEVLSATILVSLVSVPFAVSYEITDNLAVPIASHTLYNSIIFATVYSAL